MGSLPWIGDQLDVYVSPIPMRGAALMLMGFSSTSWAGRSLPLDLAMVGAPGCALQAEPVAWSMCTPWQPGIRQWMLRIPSDRDLIGSTFYNQSIVMDSAANLLGLIVSNLGTGIIGAK